METFNDWTLEPINDKASIISAYIDYSKAFDVICHNKLLHKHAAYGIAAADDFATVRSLTRLIERVDLSEHPVY